MIQRISTRTIDNMKRKSALSLQNKTYTSGMSPQMIKEYFVNLITDSDNSALSELTRVINEANESFVDIHSLGAVSGVATLGENGKVLPAQLPHIPSESDYIPQTDKGVNVATLENGKIPSTQLPSYVDDTLEGVLSGGSFLVGGIAIIPETGKIYVDTNTNLTYRWSGSIFAEISPSLALGENETTAFSGARGKALETKVGSGTLQTIEQNLIGAINEILELGVVITNWSVSKEGLNNNHTVTFNDGTTFTFTVTDGAKGKGYNPRWGWEIGKEYINDNVQIDTAYYNGTTYACKLTHIADSTSTPPNAMYWEVLATGVNPAADINKVTAVNVVGESVTINNTDDGYVDQITLEGNTIGGGGTPETPIAIQSVESPITIVNCGKNIWNATDMWTQLKAADTTNIKYVTFDNKNCISAYMPNATARALKFNYGFKANTRYRIRHSAYHAGDGHGAFFQVWYTDGTKFDWYGQPTTNTPLLNQWYYPTKGFLNYTTEANKTIDYLALTFGNPVTTYFDLDSFLITEGTEEIPYEPYQGTTLSIPIKDTIGNALTLRRAGTAYDSVYKENGKWYANLKMAKATSSVTNAEPNSTYLGTTGNGTASVTGAITVTGEVIYELATPETIELHEDTATALEAIKTYQGTTNIFGANTVNPILDVTELAMGTGEKKYALLTDSNGNAVMPVNEADNVLMRDGKTVQNEIERLNGDKADISYVENSIATASLTEKKVSFPNSIKQGKLIYDIKGLTTTGVREIGNTIFNGTNYITFYSYYTEPYDGTNTKIGYLFSSDNETWSNGGQVLDYPAEDPYVVYTNNTYYLYIEDKQAVPFKNIKLFTSTDLINWTAQGVVLDVVVGTWEEKDVSSPLVFIENEIWYMYYEGRANGQDGTIGLATSTDGINWTKSAINPLVKPASPYFTSPNLYNCVSVVPDDLTIKDNIYYMTVHTSVKNSFGELSWLPNVLFSEDKENWQPLNDLPINVEKTGIDLMFNPYSVKFYYTDGKKLYYAQNSRSNTYCIARGPDGKPASSVVRGSWDKIDTFTSIVTDMRGEFDSIEQKFIAKTSGLYNITLRVSMVYLAVGDRYGSCVRLNGNEITVFQSQGNAMSSGTLSFSGTINLFLAPGDALEFDYYVDSAEELSRYTAAILFISQ